MSDRTANDLSGLSTSRPNFTLEELCRALAAHCLLTAHPHRLHEFLTPETAEQTAQFIYRFASGEPLERPKRDMDQIS